MDHRVAQPESLLLPLPDDLMQIMSRPAPVIAHPAWREAHGQILKLVQARCHLIAILGPAGSGKTTLLRDVGEVLQHARSVTSFSEFSDDSCEFPPDGVVLVDEAERLSRESCDMLARTSDITVILTALPSFYGRFMEFREGTVVPLPLLTDEEAMAFLGEWMAQFGLPLDCLTRDAWERLIAYCRGVPRLLASLLKLSLFVGADEAASRVMLKHVEMAISVQSGSAETNLAEIAGLSSEQAPHEPDELLEIPGGELDIPPAGSADLMDESADAGPVEEQAPAEVWEKGPKPARRRRIGGWAAAGALCLAAIALLLWWNHPNLLNHRILLTQNTSAAPVGKNGLAPGTTLPIVPGGSEPASGTSQTVPAPASDISLPTIAAAPPPQTTAVSAGNGITPAPSAAVTPGGSESVSITGQTVPAPASDTSPPPIATAPRPQKTAVSADNGGTPGRETVTPSGPTPGSNNSAETSTGPATPPPTSASSPTAQSPSAEASVAATPSRETTQAPAPAGQTSGEVQAPAGSGPAPAAANKVATETKLPSGASIRVVVTYAWGDEAALQRSLDVAHALRASGFTVLDPFPVPAKRSKRGIRYYFVQDEDVADTIMHRLGAEYGAAALVRFSVIEGLPRPGTIEVDVARE